MTVTTPTAPRRRTRLRELSGRPLERGQVASAGKAGWPQSSLRTSDLLPPAPDSSPHSTPPLPTCPIPPPYLHCQGSPRPIATEGNAQKWGMEQHQPLPWPTIWEWAPLCASELCAVACALCVCKSVHEHCIHQRVHKDPGLTPVVCMHVYPCMRELKDSVIQRTGALFPLQAGTCWKRRPLRALSLAQGLARNGGSRPGVYAAPPILPGPIRQGPRQRLGPRQRHSPSPSATPRALRLSEAWHKAGVASIPPRACSVPPRPRD